MKNEIIRAIEKKTGIPQLAGLLAERLSGSELNSLLLEVFDKKTKNIRPAVLLRKYQANRFVQPAGTDMIRSLSLEIRTLEFLRDRCFQPVELSPAAPLGSCSIVGTVSQDKIVSATRDTEFLADATNSLALHIAAIKKSSKDRAKEQVLRFCTVHRHLRTPKPKEQWHTQHFKIGCLVTAGRDSGNYRFESTGLSEQVSALDGLLREVFQIKRTWVRLQRREGYPDSARLLRAVAEQLKKDQRAIDIVIDETPENNNYYKGIQFKMIVEINGQEREIADGGLVDWTQQLLGNHKERMLIAGFGLQMLQVG